MVSAAQERGLGGTDSSMRAAAGTVKCWGRVSEMSKEGWGKNSGAHGHLLGLGSLGVGRSERRLGQSAGSWTTHGGKMSRRGWFPVSNATEGSGRMGLRSSRKRQWEGQIWCSWAARGGKDSQAGEL